MWKRASEQKPPLDRMNRCEKLWLYEEDGDSAPYRGSFVDFGLDEALDPDEYTDEAGTVVFPSHWCLDVGQLAPPLPPARHV